MKASELVMAPDGTLYHIRLDAGRLADKVILVGDPQRVAMFRHIFDSIEFESSNREINVLTGSYHGTRLTALSTGMGCDNIDIVMTELDAALHVQAGQWHDNTSRHLDIVRVGTCGSLQADVDCGSHVASAYAIGLDGLMNYYREWQPALPDMEAALFSHLQLDSRLARPYCVAASAQLLQQVAPTMHHAITATAPGFYGPQGRTVRLHPTIPDLNERLAAFAWNGTKVTNLEMETSAIYGFSHLLGHEALTACLVIANRIQGTFLNDYHDAMRSLLATVVEGLGTSERR